MQFGIELEHFYLVEGQVAKVPPTIPHDDCGWLVEYRGLPYDSPFEAVGSVLAAKKRIKLPEGAELGTENFMRVPRSVKLACRREYVKGIINYQNLYDRAPSRLDHAGVHVSFTSPYIRRLKSGEIRINQMWDFSTLFRALDKEFRDEIRAARRVPGFYELKYDGRIEYRSLPQSVDLWKVAEFLSKWRF